MKGIAKLCNDAETPLFRGLQKIPKLLWIVHEDAESRPHRFDLAKTYNLGL